MNMPQKPPYHIRLETATDGTAIQQLMADCFPQSHAQRAIWRLRTAKPIADLCLVAEPQQPSTALLGSIRYWPISIGGRSGLVLGPLAVDPKVRGQGIGVALVRRSLQRAMQAGCWQWCLVSAEPTYYLKFGFRLLPADSLKLPAPIESERLHLLTLPAAKGGGDMPAKPWHVAGV